MSAALGILLICTAVLATLGARALRARADPPAWLGEGVVGNVVAPAIVGVFAIGVAMLVRFGFEVVEQRVGLADLAALGGALMLAGLLLALGMTRLRRGRVAAQLLPFPGAAGNANPGSEPPHSHAA